MATAAAAETILDRVGRWAEADPVLSGFRDGVLKVGLSPFQPSGVDMIAAAVARAACFPSGPKQLALAVPRGRGALPLFLALYFGIGRATGVLPVKGSISIATRDLSLRELLGGIHVPGANGGAIPRGRLVTGKPDSNGDASAKVGELLGTRRLHGLSQDDRFILIQAPHYRPELVLNVLSVSIVDAASMSPSGWQLTYEWNRAAQRCQVWIGELGDRRFEEFSAANEIPLWRFDWGVVLDATRRYGVGSTRLSSRELSERAEQLPAIGIRVCPDAIVDEELVKLEQAFAGVYRRTKGEDAPGVVARARRLHYLLSRLVAPLSVYEPIAAGTRALEARTVLRQVRDAPRGWFEGAQWKSVYDAEWPAIRAGLTALYDRVQAEHPKYYDALVRIQEARNAGERLIFRCATRAEAHALAAALVADGFVAPDELGEGKLVETRWFGAASPALPAGQPGAPISTVISEPLSPFAAATYMTAEVGRVEAMLYPRQAARLERLARAAVTACSGVASNQDAIAAFVDVGAEAAPTDPPQPCFERLEPFTLSGRSAVKETAETKEIISMEAFFARLADLGEDETSVSRAGASRGAEVRAARLVRAAEGFCVFLATDEEVSVLIGSESKTVLKPVSELRPGQRIILMPGADRSSMLAELFEAFDQRLGPAYPLLYARALAAAWENAGGSDRALAEKVGVEEATAATWRRGEHRPQQDDVLNSVLKLSKIEPAWTNRRRIREYLGTVRGAHRLIAKIFGEAVVETIVEVGGQRQKQLEELGLDLDEFFGSVQLLTVASVSAENCDAPGNLVGHFLSADHPAVKAAS